MKNYKYYLLFITTFLLFTTSFGQKKLTLNEAISIALNSNTNLVKSQNTLLTTEASVKNAYGDLLPSLGIGGSWGWSRTNDDGGTQLDFFGREQIIPASQIDSRSYSLSASGNVTLFNGLSNYANIKQKETNLNSALFDLDKLKQDIILQTASLYFSIISYERLLKFQEENYTYNKNLTDKIREMLDLNMITVSDVYAQDVQTANSELAFLQAKNNYEKAKINLLKYLTLDITGEYTFEAPQSVNFNYFDSRDDQTKLFEAALKSRKDFQSQKLKLESAQYQLTISRSGLFPTVSGNYRYSTSAIRPGDLFNRRIFSMGLSLNFSIFSGWNTEFAIQSAEVQIKNATEDLNALEKEIRAQVKNTLLDLETAKTQVEVTNKSLISARLNWNMKRENYELGSATFIEMQQSYRDYLQAQNNDIQAQYSYFTKQFELMNVLGRLNTEF
ncbi:MAG TPA: TolC family protein [Melioribacteraceae bacterium]|nr:TolC family protein [Melioribacteraceae bacterium]